MPAACNIKNILFLFVCFCAAPIAFVHKEKLHDPLTESRNSLPSSKTHRVLEGHPPPESGLFYHLSHIQH